MIDDKKIEEAAKYYAEENSMSVEDQMDDTYDGIEELSDAYKAGAKWTINEFLKDLWHSAKEAPNYEEWILTEWYDEDDGGLKYEADYLYVFVYWKDYVKRNNITKWCYIKDIKN